VTKHVLRRVIGVVVAIGPGKNNDGEFHDDGTSRP
jgi:hypothetical protein